MLSTILILCLFGSARSAQPATCSGGTLTDFQRNELVRLHNEYRSKLAKGTAPYKGGALPAGKDIYELEYDCTLESDAEASSENGCGQASAATEQINSQSYTSKTLLKLPLEVLLEDSVEQWTMPGLLVGITDADNKMNDADKQQTLANVANSNSLKFGCGFKNCTTPYPQVLITCKYEKPINANEVIYPKGVSCKKDEDCPKTVADPSYCDANKRLCMTTKPVITTTVAATTAKITTKKATAKTMCPYTEMTDNARRRIVAVHNNHRASVAQGQVKNGRNNYNCPKAANMFQMKYDCNLERDAINYAKQCSMGPSAEYMRPGQGENVHTGVYPGNKLTAAETAMATWAAQISMGGVNKQMKFSESFRGKSKAPLAFTQMIWARSTRVGCAVVNCHGTAFTVCRYSPKGNLVNQQIYQLGTPCGKCSICVGNGLCQTP